MAKLLIYDPISYDIIKTPIGDLLLAVSPAGVIRTAMTTEGHESVLISLMSIAEGEFRRSPSTVRPLARELREYFAGTRTKFETPLDVRLTKGYRRTVVQYLTKIRYGKTMSYAQVAAATGKPNASRAVGTACATNPLPIVVPCHRVLRSGGLLGGYGGGPEVKEFLLALERGRGRGHN